MLDAWQARATDSGDISQSAHLATAKQLIDSADQQDFGLLEKAFATVQNEHDEHTLGDVADRILIYTVQKGWGAACKVCLPSWLQHIMSLIVSTFREYTLSFCLIGILETCSSVSSTTRISMPKTKTTVGRH